MTTLVQSSCVSSLPVQASLTPHVASRASHDPNLIIDLGMHRGADTDFYLRKGFNVVAIEANPILADAGRQRFAAEIAAGRLNLLNIGVGSRAGEFEFFVNHTKDDWSSFTPDWNESVRRAGTKITSCMIRCVPLDALMRDVGVPYYLKIDVEGSDLACIEALHRLDVLPPLVSVELQTPNNLPGREEGALRSLCHLGTLGYRRFKVVDQSKNKLAKCPNPPLEGKYVDATFDGYMSGPFGEEAPGEWQTLEEVAFDYLTYLRHPLRPGQQPDANDGYTGPLDRHGWFDLHAKL